MLLNLWVTLCGPAGRKCRHLQKQTHGPQGFDVIG